MSHLFTTFELNLNQLWSKINPLIGLVSVLPSQYRIPKGFRVIVESEGTYGKAKNHAHTRFKHHWQSKPSEKNDLEKAKIWTNFDPKLTHFACPIGLVSVFQSQCRVSKGFRVTVGSEGTYGKAKNQAHIYVKHHWRSKARKKNDVEKVKIWDIDF